MKNNLTIGGATAYYSAPDDGTTHPGLIVIEEIWGVNDHIKSVADRFAQAGFVVLSPELLPNGLLEQLTPQMQEDLFDPEKRDAAQPILRGAMAPMQKPEYAARVIAILKACVDHLLADERVAGGVAVTGFCFGGTYSFHLAAHDDRVKAAVPFYGHGPDESEIAQIRCPILAFYGDQDANLMQGLPELKAQMAKAGKRFEAVVYEGAGHAFFNDTNTRMYRADYATDAWNKALAFITRAMAR